MTFEELIHPREGGRFWSEAWERQAIHVSGRAAQYHDAFLSEGEVEELLFGSATPAQPEVQLCRGAKRPLPVSLHPLWRAAPAGDRTATLRELLGQGYSMLVPSVDRFLPRLAAQLARFELRFKARCIAHLVVSPPNAAGLAPHTDSYGVFALQIAGAKTWSLYEQVPRDTGHAGSDYHHLAGTPASNRVRVAAGDLLYLPRGTVHAASTGDGGSVHLAIGLMPPRGADVVSLLSRFAEQDPFFREYVPYGIGETAEGLAEYQRAFQSRLAKLVSGLDIRTLLDQRRAERAAQSQGDQTPAG